jgi:isopenicillin-N epimerase
MTMLPSPSPFAIHWDLDPCIVFLNHGSFGACPRAVLAEQHEWQRRMEREPVRFLHRELETHLDAARAALAALLRCAADDVAFVPNATTGVNTVLQSLDLGAGDEILVTDHGYNACRNAAMLVCDRSGARIATAAIPFPITDAQTVVDRVLAAVTPRTKLCMIDHITSPTGLVLPIEPIVRALAERGIDTLVDGAHAPGMLPLDLDALGAAYYTGNCHKWLCAPKGCAFLHVRKDRQRGVRPLVISHGANANRTDRSRFRLEFDFTGTADYTPFLALPTAIAFLQALLPGGLDELRARNHALTRRGRDLLCARLRTAAPAPDAMLGSLAAVPLPLVDEPTVGTLGLDPLQVELFDRHRIEVPVMRWATPKLRLLRIACQIYNSEAQIAALAAALPN